MSAIGVVGLGKVGLVLAQALSDVAKHQVIGHDIDLETVAERYRNEDLPGDPIEVTENLADLVKHAEIIFVAVQTPSSPECSGAVPMPEEPEDFDHSFLITAINDIAATAFDQKKVPIIAIISTTVPGTLDREIVPLTEGFPLVYCPAFISLGTVLADLLNPALVLIGTNDHEAGERVAEALRPLYRNSKAIHWGTLASAEVVKMAHNCRISLDIVFSNSLAEICAGIGADVDQVIGTLERIPRFFPQAGMGDGGACRPRDVIAMMWLAETLEIPNLYETIASVREMHSLWLAREILHWEKVTELPICIMGVAYKPWVTYTDGSPALLLAHQLNDMGHTVKLYDPHVADYSTVRPFGGPHVYVIATKHPEFQEMRFIDGSVVIDPWGYWQPHSGVHLVTPGRVINS